MDPRKYLYSSSDPGRERIGGIGRRKVGTKAGEARERRGENRGDGRHRL